MTALRGLLTQAEEQLRRFSHELRPTILDNLGLRPALEFFAQGVSRRTGLPVTVGGETNGRLPPSVELALYRVVQAALNNVTKHAGATRATVQLEREPSRILCTITDNGKGLDPEFVLGRHKVQGLGLLGIRERVIALNGSLQIDSSPGRGTAIRVDMPL